MRRIQTTLTRPETTSTTAFRGVFVSRTRLSKDRRGAGRRRGRLQASKSVVWHSAGPNKRDAWQSASVEVCTGAGVAVLRYGNPPPTVCAPLSRTSHSLPSLLRVARACLIGRQGTIPQGSMHRSPTSSMQRWIRITARHGGGDGLGGRLSAPVTRL